MADGVVRGVLWALAYATKAGLTAKSNDDRKVVVKSTAVGNMYAPDPKDFVETFLSLLRPEDTVISPSGPNSTYLAACAAKCTVFWIHPGRIADIGNGKLPQHLMKLFRETPAIFYPYQEMDGKIALLRIMVQEMLGLERQVTADTNQLAQALRRERERFMYCEPDREIWVKEFSSREKKKINARLKKAGVVLAKGQIAAMEQSLRVTAEAHYTSYFLSEGKEMVQERDRIVAERLQWFGVDELLAKVEKDIRDLLVTLPENEVFDGLLSDGTHRVRAQILAFMRDPRFYPNVRAGLAYADIGTVIEGQVPQRTYGEVERGHPEFRRVLCFDFAEKYWRNDTVGFFAALYYAVKAHTYYTYWELMELTRDVFAAFGKKSEDEEEENEDAPEETGVDGVVAIDRVREFVARLEAMSHLPMIARNPRIRQEIAALAANPDPKRLWKLFARGGKGKGFRGGNGGEKKSSPGFNLQMTKKRVEQQVKRMLATVLFKAVYYRLLGLKGLPLPITEDYIYLSQWRGVTGERGMPETFDHQVVLEYYRTNAEELKAERASQGRSLPDEVEQMFVPRAERTAIATA